jgi:pimeloyl-ACP methyl ester carboxylesterase
MTEGPGAASDAGDGFTPARIAAIVVIVILALGLVYLRLAGESRVSVPDGAVAGELTLEPCTYSTEDGGVAADCGTLVVPENRSNPESRLIALPVTRIRSSSGEPAEPVFRLQGGPGITNMVFPEASRLIDRHDVVLVGYRGIDGSSVLECPEVVSALRSSADLGEEESFRSYTQVFADCYERLERDGVDLDGYSLPQRVDDLEAVRTALGYDRIDLLSESVGTRTAMIYSWRYPEALYRSVMVGVNPPGRFAWDPETTDEQLGRYAALCADDEHCGARTDDLVASMRSTADDMPGRWWFLPIKGGSVRAATLWGLFETNDDTAPLNAPTTIDAWLAAADGDASGFWFISFLADLSFPEAFVWGEMAATGAVDSEAVAAYYAAGGDPGSVLGNAATDFIWGGGGLTSAWPASPDYAGYREVQTTPVETLLVSGTLDFSTPPTFATDELLPRLPNGQQVILAGFGHSGDFWEYQPEASERLLSAFFDDGEVDDSLYTPQTVDFDVGFATDTNLAKILAGMMIGLALAALVLLAWMARRVGSRGRIGRRSSALVRTIGPLLLGLGGWFFALLIVMTIWPAISIGSQPVAVISMGVAIGLGIYLAWVHWDWAAERRYRALALALAGGLIGAWFGFGAVDGLVAVLTTIVGAAIIANLALVLLDVGLPISLAEARHAAADR